MTLDAACSERKLLRLGTVFTVEEGELLVRAVRLLQGPMRRVAARVQAQVLRERFLAADTPLFAVAPNLEHVADTIRQLEALSG